MQLFNKSLIPKHAGGIFFHPACFSFNSSIFIVIQHLIDLPPIILSKLLGAGHYFFVSKHHIASFIYFSYSENVF